MRVALLRMGGCGRRNVPWSRSRRWAKPEPASAGRGTPYFAEKEPGRVKKHFFRLSPGCEAGALPSVRFFPTGRIPYMLAAKPEGPRRAVPASIQQ